MKRNCDSYLLSNITEFKQQVLNWANQFNTCCLMDNNNYSSNNNSFEFIVATGCNTKFISSNNNDLKRLKEFITQTNDWIFGHMSYDFKNCFYPFESNNIYKINFPDAFLFQPEIVITSSGNKLNIESLHINPNIIFKEISNFNSSYINSISIPINTTARINKDDYIKIINTLKKHIQIGDCYEINFCQEFFAENIQINPLQVFAKLNKISPTPFSSYYKLNNKYLLCASPERFLKKVENKIISQPIKGTIKRDTENELNDELLKQALKNSQKEKSENVMIVDLVRNDLSKIATNNSVKVDELFAIYSFPQVHQMISTISATIKTEIDFVDILKATFPMGSMTGAPKFKVMQLIEEYEKTKRGIYSGCVGYITPKKDFDFNVVIRSIMYNNENKYLSYQVGSAITHYSNAENEYEECLLKAKAMEEALN